VRGCNPALFVLPPGQRLYATSGSGGCSREKAELVGRKSFASAPMEGAAETVHLWAQTHVFPPRANRPKLIAAHQIAGDTGRALMRSTNDYRAMGGPPLPRPWRFTTKRRTTPLGCLLFSGKTFNYGEPPKHHQNPQIPKNPSTQYPKRTHCHHRN